MPIDGFKPHEAEMMLRILDPIYKAMIYRQRCDGPAVEHIAYQGFYQSAERAMRNLPESMTAMLKARYDQWPLHFLEDVPKNLAAVEAARKKVGKRPLNLPPKKPVPSIEQPLKKRRKPR